MLKLLVCFAAIAVLATGSQAWAAPQCASYAGIAKELADKFDEHPVGHGLTGDGRLVVTLFASPDGKTWTIVTALPAEKIGCVGGAGTAWEAVPAPVPGKPS